MEHLILSIKVMVILILGYKILKVLTEISNIYLKSYIEFYCVLPILRILILITTMYLLIVNLNNLEVYLN